MAGAIIQAVANPSTVSTNPSIATTVAALSGAPVLVIAFIASMVATPVLSGIGGTWVPLVNDGANYFAQINYNPTPGSTSVVLTNGTTASDFTVEVIEISGLKTTGSPVALVSTVASVVTLAWTTNAVVPAVPVFAIGWCVNQTGSTPTSSAGNIGGSPATAMTGTGFTGGNNQNFNEGDCTFLEYLNATAGLITASGTWGGASAVVSTSRVFAFETAPVIPPGPGMMGSSIFVTA